MRLTLFILLSVSSAILFLHDPDHAGAEEDIRFALLFSGNISAELEPCG